MNRWLRAVSVIGLVSVFLMPGPAFAVNPLEGKTFSGVVGPKGKTEGQADNFVFQDGKFESTLCTTFGYGKGNYKTAAKGDATEFTTETMSKKGGKMRWRGVVKGNQIEGTAVSVENGQASESWFKGTLK